MAKPNIKNILKEIFSNPTAPYRENWVSNSIVRNLNQHQIPFYVDKFGNIVAGVSSPKGLKTGRKNIFVAHIDHPGFHLIKSKAPFKWEAKWFGGCPPKIKNTKVAIYNPQIPGYKATATITSDKLDKSKNFEIQISKGAKLDSSCFGTFDFPPYKFRGSQIITRAADDLAGVVILLSTLISLTTSERKNMVVLFSRAEEVGFMGTIGFLNTHKLNKKFRMISLEASKTLPEAIIGKGPIIRLGDRKTMFDSSVILQLDKAAMSIKDKSFCTQRRVMSGGSCEATAFNLFGIPAAGISIPLGNYHNETPNGRPGPEFVDFRDVCRAVQLCVAFQRLHSKNLATPTEDLFKAINKTFRTEKKHFTRKINFLEMRMK